MKIICNLKFAIVLLNVLFFVIMNLRDWGKAIEKALPMVPRIYEVL